MDDDLAVQLPSEDDVLGLLRGVIDPELGSNIVELGTVSYTHLTLPTKA